MADVLHSDDYEELLGSLKKKIATSQGEAARSVNKELILLYHHIGNEILARQAKYGWGVSISRQEQDEKI